MPKRGEVWLVDLGFAQKTRPALILSVPYGDKDRALVTVVSHTTSRRDSKYEIVIPTRFLQEGAFVVQSLTTIPVKHALRQLGVLNDEQLALVENGVGNWLGLEQARGG
jgi:mRNA interferase MazF